MSSYDPCKLNLADANWRGNVCPKGHKCFRCTFKQERYCDDCTELIAVNSDGQRCKLCDFDLCSACVLLPAKNWHADESDVVEPEELERAVAPDVSHVSTPAAAALHEASVPSMVPVLNALPWPDVSHVSTPAAAALQQASVPSMVPALTALPRQNRMKLRKANQASPAPIDFHCENDIAPMFPVVSTMTPRGASVAGSAPDIILVSSQSSQEEVGAPAPLVASRTAIVDSIAPAPFVASRTEIDVSSLEEWGLWGF